MAWRTAVQIQGTDRNTQHGPRHRHTIPRTGALEPTAGYSSDIGNALREQNFWMVDDTRGLKNGEHATYDSPFNHATQAILALPRDLPSPNEPAFLSRTAEAIRDAVMMSNGGTFILCTSYDAIRVYREFLETHLPSHWPVLAQTNAGKDDCYNSLKTIHPLSSSVQTPFGKGVDVRGFGLRQVIIPRLPFRVPTDPLQRGAARV